MTDRASLLALAERVEQATGPSKALDREVALLVGWRRYSPSKIRRSNPGWIAPEDFIGEYGDGSPKLDGLHGTEIHREPPDFTGSIDAALTLVPEGCWAEGSLNSPAAIEIHAPMTFDPIGRSQGTTPALALLSACLRARAEMLP